METSADVLVVDDDPTVSEVVAAYLRRSGHRVRLAADGPSAVAAAGARRPDLIVLDLMLPGFDGFEVYRRIRHLGPVPVIMLTARGEESDRILGLELGADDYVTKPFSPRELTLRANSVLRRARQFSVPPAGDGSATPSADVRRLGDIEIDVTGHQATRGGVPLALTGREFDLLAFLIAHPGQAFTRAELMRLVWGWDYGDQSTVTVHVRRLREKIELDPADPRLLVTVWGVGYRLDAPAPATQQEPSPSPSPSSAAAVAAAAAATAGVPTPAPGPGPARATAAAPGPAAGSTPPAHPRIEPPKIEPMPSTARSEPPEAVAHRAHPRSRDIDGATP